jgi:hypothetical protein
MKKTWFKILLLMAMSPIAWSITTGPSTCPDGSTRHCQGGSGRGGGYRTTCTCVQNPPPSCVAPSGNSVVSGNVIYTYSVAAVTVPDDCSNYQVVSTCNSGVFDVPPSAYPSCVVNYPQTPDDAKSNNNDDSISQEIYDPCQDPTLDIYTQYLDGCPVSLADVLSYLITTLTPMP